MQASKIFINCAELVRHVLSYCDAQAQDLVHGCDAVISGSTALHLLLPKCGTAWTPKDLDLYVPLRTSAVLLT